MRAWSTRATHATLCGCCSLLGGFLQRGCRYAAKPCFTRILVNFKVHAALRSQGAVLQQMLPILLNMPRHTVLLMASVNLRAAA